MILSRFSEFFQQEDKIRAKTVTNGRVPEIRRIKCPLAAVSEKHRLIKTLLYDRRQDRDNQK